MLEGWADNLDQEKFSEALEFGAKEAFKIVTAIKELKLEKSSSQKTPLSALNEAINEEESNKSQSNTDNSSSLDSNDLNKSVQIKEIFQVLAFSKLYDILTDSTHDKFSRDKSISDLRNSVISKILKNEQTLASNYNELSDHFYKFVRQIIRHLALDESKRVDGRKLDELRPISCKVNMFNSLHGSALFQRGQTQVLCSITFDSPDSMYKQETISSMISPSITNFNKNFMLHYEFPSFATNEIARVGGRADRREIGHGALAEKSVYPLFPENYPFTVRSLCEVLESNGSSSMASVCATSLALLDAGVPIKEPVCGVAMGIFADFDEKKEKITNYKILTDISGIEDYMGDMDFKVAGTQEGITALQVSESIY
jgi:polyribonucleotide nucleotidyltransferase